MRDCCVACLPLDGALQTAQQKLLEGLARNYVRGLQGPAKLCTVRLVVSVSAPCRRTALHLASRHGHTESVKALLGKGADVNAENNAKCAFSCLPVLDGRRLPAPAKAVRPFRLVGERVGAMQGDGTARRIFQRPHGEREGSAREGRGRAR